MATRAMGRGEGARRYTARGSVMFFKALAEQDDGDLSLMERTLPPGGRRPPPHRHTNCSEAYFVLDGLVSVIVEGEELTLGSEEFVLVPRGTAHTFGNGGEDEARLLVIHAPAMDAYFAGLHDLWNGEMCIRDSPLDHGLEKGPGNLWMFLHKRSKLPLCENLASQVSLGGDNRRARTIVDEGHFPEIVTGSEDLHPLPLHLDPCLPVNDHEEPHTALAFGGKYLSGLIGVLMGGLGQTGQILSG